MVTGRDDVHGLGARGVAGAEEAGKRRRRRWTVASGRARGEEVEVVVVGDGAIRRRHAGAGGGGWRWRWCCGGGGGARSARTRPHARARACEEEQTGGGGGGGGGGGRTEAATTAGAAVRGDGFEVVTGRDGEYFYYGQESAPWAHGCTCDTRCDGEEDGEGEIQTSAAGGRGRVVTGRDDGHETRGQNDACYLARRATAPADRRGQAATTSAHAAAGAREGGHPLPVF